ncbi:hypothetical protein D3C71_1167210 [compost metagenome]
MIGDLHDRAGRYVLPDRACRIGEDERLHAKTGERLNDRAHGGRIAFFVIVHPAGQHHHRLATEITGHQLARMAGNAACRETGKFGIGHADRIADLVHQRPQA